MPARPRLAVFTLVTALVALDPALATAGLLPWGFHAGWSAAHLGGSFGDDIGPDNRQDFTAGFFGKLGLGSGWSFQPEIAWVSKGGQGDVRSPGPFGGYEFHLEHRVNYVEVPLLMRFEVPLGTSLEPYLLAGPAPALRAGEGDTRVRVTSSPSYPPDVGTKAQAIIYEDVGTLDGTLRTTSFDLGLVGGIGLWFGRGPVRLGLEARYTQGVLDVHPSDHAEMRNAVLAVTTAIEFH